MIQTEAFRRQQPAPLAAKALSIPTPYETTLLNGLQVVIVEDDRLPLVSYRMTLGTGDAYDPPEVPGLSDIMTAMLTEGTESRTSRQIADEAAKLGATLVAGANSDYTVVAASALSTYKDQVFDLLVDVALRPAFPADELNLVKQNTKQGLIARRGQAAFLANEQAARVIYGEHPYHVVAPSAQSVDAMTYERLVSFHRSVFVPNNAVLIVVGDVTRDVVIERANALFGNWSSAQQVTSNFTAPPARNVRECYLVDRPGSAQSNVVIANLGVTQTSPDYFPMRVMHTILGANASSRLFMNLREDKGYTYGAYSSLDARRDAGSFRVSAEVRSEVVGASLTEFFYELNRIRAETVAEEELRNAQSYLTGVFPIRLETQEGLIDQLVQIKMFNLPSDYLQTYRDRINAVTKEEVQRVAREYIMPDQAAIVIVGDAAAIHDQIKPFAQHIEVYDSAGSRQH